MGVKSVKDPEAIQNSTKEARRQEEQRINRKFYSKKMCFSLLEFYFSSAAAILSARKEFVKHQHIT